jgi:Protein of unknown function (DUF1360)
LSTGTRTGRNAPSGPSSCSWAGAYGAATGAGALLVRRRRGGLPENLSPADLALLSVATHKLSRLLAKDPVTSPLRAPFTRFEGRSGEAELAENVEGAGLRKAVGELVTCPFCLGQWVATALAYGFVLAPRPTRWACTVFTALTASDVLQLAYAAAQQAQARIGTSSSAQ